MTTPPPQTNSEPPAHNLVRLNLTRPAVEALLGAQPELRVHLSQQVCEAVYKKHVLGCVANNPAIKELLSRLEQVASLEIQKQIGDIRTTWQGSLYEYQLRPEVMEHLRKQLDGKASDILRKLVEESIEKTMKGLEDMIQAKVNAMVPTLVRSKVAAVVEAISKAL